MILLLRLFIFTSCFLCCFNSGYGQRSRTVQWQFQADPAGKDEVILKFTANIAQGWHLYSQHIGEGGPIPTRFSFDNGDDYILTSQMEEKGEATKFHDADYEMEITWYTGVVSFVQRVRLAPQTTHIKGTIEFMTCNDYTCIPDKQDFNINIDPKKKSL